MLFWGIIIIIIIIILHIGGLIGLGNSENDAVVDDGDGGGGGAGGGCEKSFGSVSCSICLDIVIDNGDRSWAKLQCGHQFHLGKSGL